MKISVHCNDQVSSPAKRQAAEAVIRSLRRVKWAVASVRVHFNAIGALAGGGCRTRSKAANVVFSLGKGGL